MEKMMSVVEQIIVAIWEAPSIALDGVLRVGKAWWSASVRPLDEKEKDFFKEW
jgi:hypothetical protein